jgi:hypothetical protein
MRRHVVFPSIQVGDRAVLRRMLRLKYEELGPMTFHQVGNFCSPADLEPDFLKDSHPDLPDPTGKDIHM